MDGFRFHYNRERPHQGIGDLTPAERYAFSPPVAEAPMSLGVDEHGEPVYPPQCLVRKVNRVGVLGFDGKSIQVGRRWTGATMRVIPVGPLIHIYYGEQLVRVLALDPAVTYQALGKEVRLPEPVA